MYNPIFYNERRMRAGWRIFFFMLAFSAVQLILFSVYLRFSPLSKNSLPEPDESTHYALRDYVPPSPDDPQFLEWNLYLSFFVTVGLLALTLLFLRNIDHRPWPTLGLSVSKSGFKELLLGLGIGSLLITLVFALALGLGVVRIAGTQSENLFATTGQLALLALVVGAVFEELLVRGYLFQAMLEGLGVYPTIAVTSIFFAMLHIPNLMVLDIPSNSLVALMNIALAGVLLSIAYLRTRALWLPIGLHFAWNFLQAFIFSAPVSGLNLAPKVLKIELHGDDWLTGGAFGLEGSIVATIVLGAACLWLWVMPWLKPSEKLSALWHEHIKPAPRGGDLL
jgi:hypothetical protein